VCFYDFPKLLILERETGIEPATNSLEGCDSTTELLPQPLNRPHLPDLAHTPEVDRSTKSQIFSTTCSFSARSVPMYTFMLTPRSARPYWSASGIDWGSVSGLLPARSTSRRASASVVLCSPPN
jgi:hypothetical protein